MGRKVLVVIILGLVCSGTAYLLSPLLYSEPLSKFTQITSGDIPGTHFSFVVEEAAYSSQKMYYIQNSFTHIKRELVEVPEDNLGYTMFTQGGNTYLIAKHFI